MSNHINLIKGPSNELYTCHAQQIKYTLMTNTLDINKRQSKVTNALLLLLLDTG